MMENYEYDVFISHNSADKPAVELIANTLEAQKLTCFLDKWDILPGDQWMRNLENGLANSRMIVIFIGTNGIGPYQREEIYIALRRKIQQRQDCIIPVLLPGASPEDIAKFSSFLLGINALRFYDLEDPLPHRILAGLLRGENPNHLRQLIRAAAHAPPDLLQTLNDWLNGLCIEWQEMECQVSEGQGKRCLNIPNLSDSFNPDNIEYLLSWKSQLTELFGREQELATLHDWADSPNKISCRLIVGEGGTGKTRLAFELARQLKQQKGWQAGEAQGLTGCWYTGNQGTLLIIDYPEQRSEKVAALLETLARQPLTHKLRVLLLGRNGDFLNKLTQPAQSIVDPNIRLEGLAVHDFAGWNLFQQAWQQLHAHKQLTVPPLPMALQSFQQWQQQNTAHQRPLFVLALAIRLMLDAKAHELSAQAIIRALTQQYEVNRLIKEARQQHLDPYSLVMLRALAVLSGKLESKAVRDLVKVSKSLQLDIQLPTLRQIKETSLWSQEAIHMLQPDLLAADLLHYTLTELAGDQAGIWQFCGLEAKTPMEEAIMILERLIHDTQILQQRWPLQYLIDWVSQKPEQCRQLNDALSHNFLSHDLLPLAMATDQVLLKHTDLLPEKIRILSNFSIRQNLIGDCEGGFGTILRVLSIIYKLPEEDFYTYFPELANVLHNTSIHLADIGDREFGLKSIQLAIEMREFLVKQNFTIFGSGLADSLHTRAIILFESGESDAAIKDSQQSVNIHEQLAEENFAIHIPNHIACLQFLFHCLVKCDQIEDAEEVKKKLQIIKQRVSDEKIQISASLARLLE